MARIPLFKPFPVKWSRMLGGYLLVVVAVQTVIYLTLKNDPAVDYIPFNDPRWALHVCESIVFDGLQYRYLTWFSVFSIGCIAVLMLARPFAELIAFYIVIEAIYMSPNIIASFSILSDPRHYSVTMPTLAMIWSLALVTNLIPMTLLISILRTNHVRS